MPPVREHSSNSALSSTKKKRRQKRREKGLKKPRVRVPASDPATWRESCIPVDEKITSSQAWKWYQIKRLGGPEIHWEISAKRVLTADSGRLDVTYLASHREVERNAWMRHNGPEGWEQYQSQQREQWKDSKPFPEPDTRTISDDEADVKLEIGHISPKLQQLFEEFFLHFRNLWVWTKCNAILHAAGVVDSSLREKHLKTALETLPPSPPRKTSRSRVKSFRRFCNEVLRRAPMKVGDAGLETVRLASGGTRHIWSVEYLAEVYEMLNSIIDKYGIEGWKRIRWTVYKTYEEFTGGIYFDTQNHTWVNPAFHWLAGRAEPGSIIYSERSKCQAGIDYNKRLPVDNM